MDNKEIQDLIKLINKTNIAEFKLKKDDFEIVVRSNQYQKPGNNPPAPPSIVNIPTPQVAAPMPVQVAAPEVIAPKVESPVVSEPAESSEANLLEIKSPIVGTFYRSPGPDKPAFIKVGDVVAKGDTVCIVEAMKLFNEIETEVAGKIVKVLLEDASPVQYDQPLFLVDPKG